MALMVVAVELALVGGVLWLARRPVRKVGWRASSDMAAVATATSPVPRAEWPRVTSRPLAMTEETKTPPLSTLTVVAHQATEEIVSPSERPAPAAVTPSPGPATRKPVVSTPTASTEILALTATTIPTQEPSRPLPPAKAEVASAAGVSDQLVASMAADLPDDVSDVEVVELARQINQARVRAGLPMLAWCWELALAAQMHAEDMAAHGFVSHAGSDGSEAVDRMRRAGYEPAFRGEIIAWVPGGYELAFAWWWKSQLHRETMLGEAYRDFGIARVPHPTRPGHNYFVVVFGRRQE